MRNPVGQKLRHAALLMALEDMEAWLEMGGCWGVLHCYCAVLSSSAALPSCPIATMPHPARLFDRRFATPGLPAEGSQVAVLDATNSTEERRNFLRTRFHGRCCLQLAGWAVAGCLARGRLPHVLHAVCGRLGFGSQGFAPCAAAVFCHIDAGKWQYLFIESICNDMEVGLSGVSR